MIKINIICIGKIKEKYFTDAIAEYAKRLTAFCKFNIIELSEERIKSNIPNRSQIDEVIFSEGKRIMQKISPSDYVVAMCIEGKSMSSEELSKLIDNASVPRGTGAIICLRETLSAIDSSTYIVPVWMI